MWLFKNNFEFLEKLDNRLIVTANAPSEGQLANRNKSLASISIAHNPIQYDRMKHIEIYQYFIKEKLDNRLIVTANAPSECQLANCLVLLKDTSSVTAKDDSSILSGLLDGHNISLIGTKITNMFNK
ncbi:hypothetical protein CR513_34591, partial [Mucuna pruriens]